MKLKFTFLITLLCLVIYAQKAPEYYSNIDFNKKNNELKDKLADLIINTHKKSITYGELKSLLAISDVDPENPANLLLIYGSQNSGKHQRSRIKSGTWNREHVYAKSKGDPNLGTSKAGADGHHLRPADNSLNSERGHLSFDDGFGAMATKTSRGGWYPGDEWKGDVARILMYMYVRYKEQCLPLRITFGPTTYSSDFPDILLKWNKEDPVSVFEKQRNDIVATTQGNRNPFIDNPYLATLIWGGDAAQNTWPDTFSGGSTVTDDTEAPTVPTNLKITNSTSNTVSLSWTASTDNVGVSKYDIYVNDIFNTSVNFNNATISNLKGATNYNFYIVAKDAAGNKSEKSESINITTEEDKNTNPEEGTSCGIEDFEKIISTGGYPPASSYTDRTWTNNGIIWTATNARTDKQIYINGDKNKAICLRKGSLKSSTISGGIGSLSVRTMLPFGDKDGSYTLLINGEEKGQIPYSKTAKTTTIENINIEGNVVIELIDNSTNNRVSFDDLSWTCYDKKLATDEIKTKTQRLTIYPNPVKNNEIYLEGIDKNETVQIYNLNGQMVQLVENVNPNSKITLRKLPKGVYILKTKKQSSKLIVN